MFSLSNSLRVQRASVRDVKIDLMRDHEEGRPMRQYLYDEQNLDKKVEPGRGGGLV